MFKNYANDKTPAVNGDWAKLSDQEKLDKIKKVSLENNEFSKITPIRALENGTVFIELEETVSVSTRGMMILDYEAMLKSKIDIGIVVWCEPIGDKNSLRKLRGIQIKS